VRGPERKFDPARADRLDAPERDSYLPDAPLVALLGLGGEETVIDYGAGTGRLAIAARAALGAGGRVIAVDEGFVPRSTCPVCGEVLVPYDEGVFPQLICERDRLVLVGE
jgi:hypothetical protein